MCGIFGIIAQKVTVPAGVLEQATQSLAHRGPDDGGTVRLHPSGREAIEVGLGNRRLAILDLSALGRQPMNDPATGNWIVYNGEVFNFREVRAKLERAGHRFISSSDTEVVLKAYAHWGENCLHEFRGMFAFAIWDENRRLLFVARDPMGIKPLYYYQSDHYFLFSSELRSLLRTGLVPRRVDCAGLSNYLAFGSFCEPITLVENVSALPPGHFLTWEAGRVSLRQYWDLLDPLPLDPQLTRDVSNPGQREIEDEISTMLDDVVRMQLVSDVPVGVFLSGGIDSSALVGVLARNGVRPSTFSIGFREADYSELVYSRLVAQQFRTDHHEITVSQSDLLACVGPAVRAMDLPTIDGLNTFLVSQRARAAGVKVALSGLGGDEMFGGYSSFRNVPRMERFAAAWDQLPALARKPLAGMFAAVSPSTDQNRKLTALVEREAVTSPYFLSRMLFTPEQSNRLSAELQASEVLERAHKSLDLTLRRAQSLDPINRVSYLEARCYMLNTLLRDTDSMSMAHGLEVRVPLIDHHLASKLLQVPGAWKLDSATPKPLLVQALRGALPKKIVHRAKRGFTLPLEHWLRYELRPTVDSSLHRLADSVLGPFLSQPAALEVWDNFIQGRTSWSRPWSLYVLQCWCELHLSN
jgi:asparagine synthase (glutamine-hydrolysing)